MEELFPRDRTRNGQRVTSRARGEEKRGCELMGRRTRMGRGEVRCGGEDDREDKIGYILSVPASLSRRVFSAHCLATGVVFKTNSVNDTNVLPCMSEN